VITERVVAGVPCGPHPIEIQRRERVVVLCVLVVSLWVLFLIGSLALGVTFLAGGVIWASVLCLWVFGGLVAAPVVLNVAERLTAIAKLWLGEQTGEPA
jgi:hypothetical protein